MKKRIAVIALATAALLATSAAATAKPAGKKLGGVLKVVAWEGYTENQWVKPFEKQTGCKVQHQYAGSSDEMYNLMKKNAGYDLVSASGDASNRLIASGLVQPIDPKYDSRTGSSSRPSSSRARTTTSAASTTACPGSGARTC